NKGCIKKKIPEPSVSLKEKAGEPVIQQEKFTLPKPARKLEKFISPMLASLGDGPFDDPEWIFELKWDGYRAIAECSGSEVKLYSRNGLYFNERYPVIVQELQKLKLKAVIDGEVVLLNEDDRHDFQKLQHYDSNRNLPLIYYVFDLLSLDGDNYCNESLIER